MKVEKGVLATWKEYHLRGDADKIYETNNGKFKKESIRVCLAEGEYIHEEVFEVVSLFYKERIQKAKEIGSSVVEVSENSNHK